MAHSGSDGTGRNNVFRLGSTACAVSKLLAISKDHENTCGRLIDSTKMIEIQLRELRAEHETLKAETQALRTCLDRRGVVPAWDLEQQLFRGSDGATQGHDNAALAPQSSNSEGCNSFDHTLGPRGAPAGPPVGRGRQGGESAEAGGAGVGAGRGKGGIAAARVRAGSISPPPKRLPAQPSALRGRLLSTSSGVLVPASHRSKSPPRERTSGGSTCSERRSSGTSAPSPSALSQLVGRTASMELARLMQSGLRPAASESSIGRRPRSLSPATGAKAPKEARKSSILESGDSGGSSDQGSDLYDLVRQLLDANDQQQGNGVAEHQQVVRAIQRVLKSSPEPPNSWHGEGTPLSTVVKAGRLDLTRLFLRARADPNDHDAKGVSALHLAAFDGNLDICRSLLMARANVDSCDRHGQTPLFFAPTRDVCKLLTEKRADLSVVNRRGQTALHLAGRAGLSDVLAWFSTRVNKSLTELRDAHGATARNYLDHAGFMHEEEQLAMLSVGASVGQLPSVSELIEEEQEDIDGLVNGTKVSKSPEESPHADSDNAKGDKPPATAEDRGPAQLRCGRGGGPPSRLARGCGRGTADALKQKRPSTGLGRFGGPPSEINKAEAIPVNGVAAEPVLASVLRPKSLSEGKCGRGVSFESDSSTPSASRFNLFDDPKLYNLFESDGVSPVTDAASDSRSPSVECDSRPIEDIYDRAFDVFGTANGRGGKLLEATAGQTATMLEAAAAVATAAVATAAELEAPQKGMLAQLNVQMHSGGCELSRVDLSSKECSDDMKPEEVVSHSDDAAIYTGGDSMKIGGSDGAPMSAEEKHLWLSELEESY